MAVHPPSLEKLEQDAYRESYSDGIVDVFVGVSLLWIGIAWLWLPDIAGMAGVLPAVFVAPMLAGRKRIVESRAGYVKWTVPRRSWEHRNLLAAFAGGALMLAIGVAVFIGVDSSSSVTVGVEAIMPGLLAWLLALMTIGLGFLMSARRLFGYAGVLAISGAVTAAADASPGWPMLVTGIIVAAYGVVMLRGFLQLDRVVSAP